MNENTPQTPRRPSATSAPPPQSIPLQDLQRPEDAGTSHWGGGTGGIGSGGTAQGAWHQHGGTRTHNASGDAPSPITMSANLPGFSSYWEHPYPHADDPGGASGGVSPID